VTVPRHFNSAAKQKAVKCSFKSTEGYLFPLEKSFFFVHKPPTMVRHDEISSIDFFRISGDMTVRTFDLQMNLKNLGVHSFKMIPKEEYQPLLSFIRNKKITVNGEDGEVALASVSSSSEEETEKTSSKRRKSSRSSVTDVRTKMQQAMKEAGSSEDESDVDFGAKDKEASGSSSSDSVDYGSQDDDEFAESSSEDGKKQKGDKKKDKKDKKNKEKKNEKKEKRKRESDEEEENGKKKLKKEEEKEKEEGEDEKESEGENKGEGEIEAEDGGKPSDD
jgi:structure-specific recognition protein 1